MLTMKLTVRDTALMQHWLATMLLRRCIILSDAFVFKECKFIEINSFLDVITF